jgi:hypothetical protein
MDELIEVLEEPKNKKWGLYKLKFKSEDREYIGYQTCEEFRVTKIKQKLFLEKDVCLDDINEFEDAVRKHAERENIENKRDDI